jgi:ATP-dependent DNA helicase RecG
MLPADLGRKSVRRPPLIADLLHRIDFIEKAGTGIKRMRDEARECGCPDPVYEATNFFTATFYPNPAVRQQARLGQATDTPQVRDQVGTKFRNQVLKGKYLGTSIDVLIEMSGER